MYWFVGKFHFHFRYINNKYVDFLPIVRIRKLKISLTTSKIECVSNVSTYIWIEIDWLISKWNQYKLGPKILHANNWQSLRNWYDIDSWALWTAHGSYCWQFWSWMCAKRCWRDKASVVEILHRKQPYLCDNCLTFRCQHWQLL